MVPDVEREAAAAVLELSTVAAFALQDWRVRDRKGTTAQGTHAAVVEVTAMVEAMVLVLVARALRNTSKASMQRHALTYRLVDESTAAWTTLVVTAAVAPKVEVVTATEVDEATLVADVATVVVES